MADEREGTWDCPICGEADAVTYRFDWEPPDWSVGIWGGWGGEITPHCPLTKKQTEALEDAIAWDLNQAGDH